MSPQTWRRSRARAAAWRSVPCTRSTWGSRAQQRAAQAYIPTTATIRAVGPISLYRVGPSRMKPAIWATVKVRLNSEVAVINCCRRTSRGRMAPSAGPKNWETTDAAKVTR